MLGECEVEGGGQLDELAFEPGSVGPGMTSRPAEPERHQASWFDVESFLSDQIKLDIPLFKS
jgi:hypothetical protein